MKNKLILLSMLFLTACADTPSEPCPVKSDNQAAMDTALKALMVTQGYWITGC